MPLKLGFKVKKLKKTLRQITFAVSFNNENCHEIFSKSEKKFLQVNSYLTKIPLLNTIIPYVV